MSSNADPPAESAQGQRFEYREPVPTEWTGDGSSLGALLDQLGPALIDTVGAVADKTAPVGEVVLWDPLEQLPPTRGGLLLLVGCAPTHPLIVDTITTAGRLGYTAVVLKSRGTHPSAAADAAERAGVTLLTVADDVAWTRVESLLVAAMAAHGGGAAEGLGTQSVSDLFALANAVANRTGAAITIEAVDRQVLAYSNVPGQPIDQSRQDTILGRYVPDLPEHQDEYRELARSPGPVRFGSYASTLARVVMPVRVGGRLIGSIWAIDADGNQGERIAAELVALAPQVALHLLRAANRSDVERHHRSEVLAAVLRSPGGSAHTDRQLTTRQLPVALLGFRAVHGSDDVVDQYRLTNLVTLTLEASSRDAWCAQLDDTIFVLLPRADRFVAGWVEQLATTAVTSVAGTLGVRLGCGYSPRIDAHEGVPAARSAIETVLRRQATVAGAAVVDVSRDRYLVQMQTIVESGIGAPGQLVPEVAAVLEHDRVHRSSYARTLLAHLDYFGDVRRAAEALSVHENSQRYRMRKLTEQFGIRLDDPELRLVVWLQLRIALGLTSPR